MRCRMFSGLFVTALLFVTAGCGMSPVDDGGGNASAGTFTVYSADDGLIGNFVNDVAVDLSRNGVWVATTTGISFCSMTDSSWTSYVLSDGLPDLEVNTIGVHSDTVWAGTVAGPAFLTDSKWNELPDTSILHNRYITAIAGNGNSIWFGIRNEGVVHRSPSGTFTVYTTSNGLSAGDVTSIGRASDGDVWVGTSSTLSVFDGSAWSHHSMPLSNVFIQSIYGDASGSVWVGTSGGVMVFTGSTSRNYGTADGLPSASVNDFAEDSGHTLWVAADGGVAWFDGTVWHELSLPGEVSGCRVTSLAAGGNGSLWIGTSGGLVRYRPE